MTPDADVMRLLEAARISGSLNYDQMTPTEARAAHVRTRQVNAAKPPPVDEIRYVSVPAPHGPIPLRVYRPRGAGKGALPVVIYFHGGGWVVGDLNTVEATCCRLANASGSVVVSVDYRLAPEHKFPAAVDDAFAAAVWVTRQGEALNINSTRVAVGGESAGATLAIVVAMLARDAGAPLIRYQALVYPVTDFTMNTESHRQLAEGYLLTGNALRWYVGHYLRTQEDADDWRASPLQAGTFAGLPPAFVMTAELDPLRDEGEIYARRLAVEANVPVTLWRVPSQIHGFISFGNVIAAAGPAVDVLGSAVKSVFSRP